MYNISALKFYFNFLMFIGSLCIKCCCLVSALLTCNCNFPAENRLFANDSASEIVQTGVSCKYECSTPTRFCIIRRMEFKQ